MFLTVALGSRVPVLGLLLWTFGRVNRLRLGEANAAPKEVRAWFLVGTVAMGVGFSVRNLFDYMFAGSLANLFWIVVAMALCQRVVSRTFRNSDAAGAARTSAS